MGVKGRRRVGLITSPPSVSLLSTKCEILDVSQPYWPSWSATGIAFTITVYTLRFQNLTLWSYLRIHSPTILLWRVLSSGTPCSLAEVHRRFGGAHFLHIFLATCLTFRPWREYFFFLISTTLHYVTYQKITMLLPLYTLFAMKNGRRAVRYPCDCNMKGPVSCALLPHVPIHGSP
jgi:hypothetical protein